ncbi:hypothetical protein [Kosakonia oryziphila]|nr:hypothetical protein [Kosakonia oryziphila]
MPEAEEDAAEAVYKESVDEQPTTSEVSDANADLRARVKQAMAGIDNE